MTLAPGVSTCHGADGTPETPKDFLRSAIGCLDLDKVTEIPGREKKKTPRHRIILKIHGI